MIPLWNATTLRKIKKLPACDRCRRAQANSSPARMGAALQQADGSCFAIGNVDWCNGCLREILAAGWRGAIVVGREEEREPLTDNMHDETIRRWCHNEMRAHVDSVAYRRAKAILAMVDCAVAPPWLADAAEALGRVRPCDGAPLALNWNQVLQEIHELRDERDHWKKRAESAEYALTPFLDESGQVAR